MERSGGNQHGQDTTHPSGPRIRAKSFGPVPIVAASPTKTPTATAPPPTFGPTAKAILAPLPAANGSERRMRLAIAVVTSTTSVALLHRNEDVAHHPSKGDGANPSKVVGHVELSGDEGNQITCTTMLRHDFKGTSYFLLFVGTSNGTVLIADANENGRVLVACQLPRQPPGKQYSVVQGNEPVVAICATSTSNASLLNPWIALGDEGGTPVGGGGQVYTRSVDVLHRSGWTVTIYEEQLDLLLTSVYQNAGAVRHADAYQRPSMTRDYEVGDGSGRPTRFPCSGVPPFTASLLHGYLLIRGDDVSDASRSIDGANDLGAVSASTALLHAPGISPLGRLHASISTKHQRLMVVVGRTIGFYSLHTKPAAALSGGKAALEVAGRLTGAAVRAVKGFWGGGGSKSGGRLNDPATPYLTNLGPVVVQHTLPLVGVDIHCAVVSPTAHYAALISSTDRVYVVDLVTGTVCNVLKGCRQVDVQWVVMSGHTGGTTAQDAMLLAVYFGLRGVVEFHSIAQAQRVAACRTATGLHLARVEGPGLSSDLLLLSPDASAEWRVRLRFARQSNGGAALHADGRVSSNGSQEGIVTTPQEMMATIVRRLATRSNDEGSAGSVVEDVLKQQTRGWMQVLNARDTSVKMALRIRDNIVDMLFVLFQRIVAANDRTSRIDGDGSAERRSTTGSSQPPLPHATASIVDGASWTPTDVRDALTSVCDAWILCIGEPHAREEHCTPFGEAPSTRAQKFHVVQQARRAVELFIALTERLQQPPSPPPSPSPEVDGGDGATGADSGTTSTMFAAVSSLLRGFGSPTAGGAASVSWKSTFAQVMSRLTLSDERTIYAMPHGIELWKDVLQRFEACLEPLERLKQLPPAGNSTSVPMSSRSRNVQGETDDDSHGLGVPMQQSIVALQRFLKCFSFQQHGIRLTRRHEEALDTHEVWTQEAEDVAAVGEVCYGGLHGVLTVPLVARQAPMMAELGITGATAGALLLRSQLSVVSAQQLPLLTMQLSACDPVLQSTNVGHLRGVLKFCPLRSVVETTGTMPLPRSTTPAGNSDTPSMDAMWLNVMTRVSVLGIRAAMDGEKAAHRAEAVRMMLRLVAHAHLVDACAPLCVHNVHDDVNHPAHMDTVWTRCCEASAGNAARFRVECPVASALCAVGCIAPDKAGSTAIAIADAVGAWCLTAPPSQSLVRATSAALWMEGLTTTAVGTIGSNVRPLRWLHSTTRCVRTAQPPEPPIWSLQTFQRLCLPCMHHVFEAPSSTETKDDDPLLHAAVLWALARDLLVPQRKMVLETSTVRSKDVPPNAHDMGGFMDGAGQRAMEAYLKAATSFTADVVDAVHKTLQPFEHDELAARMTLLVKQVLVTEEDGQGNTIALFPRYDPSVQVALMDFDGLLAQHAYNSDGVFMSLLDVQSLCSFLKWCVVGATFGQHHCDLLRTVPWSNLFAVPSFRCLGRDAVYPQLTVELHASMAEQRHEERMLFVGSVVQTLLRAQYDAGTAATHRPTLPSTDALDALRTSIRDLGDALQLRDLACDCATDCGAIAYILKSHIDQVSSGSSGIVKRILSATPFRSVCATVGLLFLRRYVYTSVKWYASLEKGIPAENKEARTKHSTGSIRLRTAMSNTFQSWLREKHSTTSSTPHRPLDRNGAIDAQFFFLHKEDDVAVDTLFRQCAGEGRLPKLLSAMRAVSELVENAFTEQSTDRSAVYATVASEMTAVIDTIQQVLLPLSSS